MNPISLNLGPVAAHPSGAAGRIQSEPNGKRRNDKAHPPPGGLGPPGAASRTGGEARDRGPIAPSKQPDSEPQNPAKPANADAETAPSKLQASTAEAEVPLAAPSWGVPENFQSLVVSVMGGTQPIIAEPAAAPIPDSLRAEATAGTVPSVAQAGSVSIPGFVLGDRAGDAAQPGEAQAAELPVEDALAAELVPGPLIQGSSGSESQSVAEVPEPILSQIFDSTQLGSDSSGNAAQTPQQVAKPRPKQAKRRRLRARPLSLKAKARRPKSPLEKRLRTDPTTKRQQHPPIRWEHSPSLSQAAKARSARKLPVAKAPLSRQNLPPGTPQARKRSPSTLLGPPVFRRHR
ncbi:MAG: hypothetical protein UZ18_ATM001002411 [Armatimonadetes bacterium OLB18]|nr:MAG: hypothetical protein UZ18_ATM001002411 [Armatimonadetes bacterium OLB18]